MRQWTEIAIEKLTFLATEKNFIAIVSSIAGNDEISLIDNESEP